MSQLRLNDVVLLASIGDSVEYLGESWEEFEENITEETFLCACGEEFESDSIFPKCPACGCECSIDDR